MKSLVRNVWMLMAALALIACDPLGGEWRAATQHDTVEAYEAFIIDNPDAKRVDEARGRIESLEWDAIKKSEDLPALQAFIQKYPGAFKTEVADRLSKVETIVFSKDKKRLFSSFDENLMGFINRSDSLIASMNGKSREDQSLLFGIVSGGFAILNGVATPRPGSVVAYEDPDKKFLITGKVREDGRTLTTIESAEFQSGVSVHFATGETYEYREGEWERITE